MDFEINPATYRWSVRLFSLLRRLFRINLKLHEAGDRLAEGDIFLFNHFARFETFIPQYFIYAETGAYCRSVAGADFFVEGDPFSNYLIGVGAVSNDHPRLLPFLAGEILRGRKVVIFPEGGMVKDRRVLDEDGDFSVYSRKAREWRRHHTGAAVLGLALDTFKQAVRAAADAGHSRRIDAWAEGLGLPGATALLAAARKPTCIVPANITFWPVRIGDNLLRQGAGMLARGRLTRRLSEELLIEGNLLLKHTDMDIRFGEPVRMERYRGWMERHFGERALSRITTVDDCFALDAPGRHWTSHVLGRLMRGHARQVRDECMRRMYEGVTVNLSHLASRLIFERIEAGEREVPCAYFHRLLYLTVKHAQRESGVRLHRSLRNPEAYGGLPEGRSRGLARFLRTTRNSALVERSNGSYRFLPKLREESGFDEVRLENPVLVYANEVAPIRGVHDAIRHAYADSERLGEEEIAKLRFDDECIEWAWDREAFSRERHAGLNAKETATEPGGPFLFLPEHVPAPLGVVAAHGFLASPAEMHGLGRRLDTHDLPVIGVRLKGHGTSPWDLRERSYEDWLDSVRRGYAIMSGLAQRVCVVGFSSGGALALLLAAEHPERLAGVIAVNVPLYFRNPNMKFVPLVHRANRVVQWVSSFEGVMPFRPNKSEHPHINYHHMPVHGLYELTRMVDALEKELPGIDCPVHLLQADRDPVVVPRSVHRLTEGLERTEPVVRMVGAARHGIVNEDLDGTQDYIVRRVLEFRGRGRTV